VTSKRRKETKDEGRRGERRKRQNRECDPNRSVFWNRFSLVFLLILEEKTR